MKQPLGLRLFNASVSLVALAAWVVASNHCAIAGSLPKAAEQAAHAHCHASEEAPAQEEKQRECDGSRCCKSLSAPTLAFAKTLIAFDSQAFVPATLPALELTFATGDHDAPTAELDTGPPPVTSFAESVLQRSILAHAPPRLS